jgi:hypothetical protein
MPAEAVPTKRRQPRRRTLRCFPLPVQRVICPVHRAGGSHIPGIVGIGYSLRVRGVLGAGSRAAVPLRFSVTFEYGGVDS